MRIPVPAGSGPIRFNLTPLIDVVFNLIIFFLVATHFARSEPAEPVALPTASRTADDENPRRLMVTILRDGRYFVGPRNVTLDDIERMIAEGAEDAPQEYAVRIRGDRDAPYRFVEPVMLACARHGVTTFGFNVLQK